VTDLAERIERAALEDVYAAAEPALRERLGIRAPAIGGAFVGIAGRLPATAIVLNRTLGLGLSAPATAQDVADIVAAYRAAGVERFFVNLPVAARPAAIADWLEGQGLVKVRAWQKFERGREPPPAAPTDLAIREIGREHGRDFARIACAAFDLGDAAVDWIACLPGRPCWRVVMAFDGERPAATGALFMKDGCGWFDFGATAPEYRRRGAQQALLRRRVLLALESGCERLYTETGEAVPGDPQHSYSNILRMGFRETERRENFAPPRRG
jgi:GNAT superfamily N-acetyltransferase